MNIHIKHEPYNPSGFVRGVVLGYPGNEGSTLVVGEDDTHVHTFTLDGFRPGSYYGIFKRKENLSCLEVRDWPDSTV